MRLALIAFTAAVALGQTNRVFELTQNQTRQQLEEIATVLRVTADLPQVSFEDATRTVTVAGTPGQIAMADWLLHRLDRPATGRLSGVQEYRPPAGGDDVVRVFYVTHAGTPREPQEIAATIRAAPDIPRVSVYTPLKVIAVRGTKQQMSLAAWLMDQLNQPPNRAATAPHEYHLPGDDVARVFELTHAQTPQQLQEIATLIRAIGDIWRLFPNQARRAVMVRATAEQVALAAWLVTKLDKPVSGQTAMQDTAAPQEYWLSTAPENLVRVFYLPDSQSAQERQQVATQVRLATGIKRLFVYNALGALAVRGTVDQVATAERLIEEMKTQ